LRAGEFETRGTWPTEQPHENLCLYIYAFAWSAGVRAVRLNLFITGKNASNPCIRNHACFPALFMDMKQSNLPLIITLLVSEQ
jgi:hypothetical protein